MKHGEFSGHPLTRWVEDLKKADRHMELLEDFWFKDPKGKRWTAAKKYKVDGATIPRALWTLVGSPYTGDYRRGSIVHDIACDEAKTFAERLAADRMYFHACRAGGCSRWEATIQYIGVRIGAYLPETKAWQTDSAATQVSPRLTRHPAEIQLERDFQRSAELVLSQGETDDPFVLEERTEIALNALGVRTGPRSRRSR